MIRTIAAIAASLALASTVEAAGVGTCTIVVDRSGKLVADAQLTTLSTRNANGAAARIRVSASFGGAVPSLACTIGLPLNCARLTLTPPTLFASAPSGEQGGVLFDGDLALETGAAPILVRMNAREVLLLNGSYTFLADLKIQKPSGIFGRGTYQAVQTVTCE